jgi:acyl carrier protein
MGNTAAAGAQHDALFETVHQTVVRTIIEVVGEEFYEESEINLDSTFSEDIELESTELMEIAERMMETYAGKVDFVAWFADMELEELVQLRLRDLLEFIVTSIEEHGDDAVAEVLGQDVADVAVQAR